MQIIKESFLHDCYMLRNDGKEFVVPYHVYGDIEDTESSLPAAEWLFNHTRYKETKQIIIALIRSWSFNTIKEKNLIEDILNYIDDAGYDILTKNFVLKIKDELLNADIEKDDNKLNKLFIDRLNQEFIRVRYGGKYDTEKGSKEIVFRVSSKYFNWFDIIYMFVYNHKRDIMSVTIVQDQESLGTEKVYTYKGEKYDQMPIDEFLSQSGNPIIENKV